ncbi:unnamed protein product [Cyclocybe aegerita]|uniref:Uncharacterized protein n=1 Tax=Cyclocybe aegerita TaxID=1973307 RepID=A0A8S0W018_CYCAE|nr:unnamed protein product [Cyclocybe aegerita]
MLHEFKVRLRRTLAPPASISSSNDTVSISGILDSLFAETPGQDIIEAPPDGASCHQFHDAGHLEREEVVDDSPEVPEILGYDHTRAESEGIRELENPEERGNPKAQGPADNWRFPTPGDDSDGDGERSSNSTSPLSLPPTRNQNTGEYPQHPETLIQINQEMETLYELEKEQAEQINILSRKVFAAAWRTSLSTPKEIRDHCLGKITDLLGSTVGQEIDLDAGHLRGKGKLPERPYRRHCGYSPVTNISLARRHDEALEGVEEDTSLGRSYTLPIQSTTPPFTSTPPKKRLREEDAVDEEDLSTENWLHRSRKPPRIPFSSEEAPPTKRARSDMDSDCATQ